MRHDLDRLPQPRSLDEELGSERQIRRDPLPLPDPDVLLDHPLHPPEVQVRRFGDVVDLQRGLDPDPPPDLGFSLELFVGERRRRGGGGGGDVGGDGDLATDLDAHRPRSSRRGERWDSGGNREGGGDVGVLPGLALDLGRRYLWEGDEERIKLRRADKAREAQDEPSFGNDFIYLFIL
ncbi:uncharacterized protein A4U43_C04F34850 [Asparagus officinalis]|uniref:Uncharacterized protein n=1 Tax=Asparagus officinalis TaxID=4686 RepID=A0A5P1F5W8_ASPOF|nr:uncharacterized protein A4U43_C04F34850 [Asparagus officinalis]